MILFIVCSVHTDRLLYSFADHDMLVRHFSHGIGHLKYEKQPGPEPEIGPKSIPRGDGNHDNNITSKIEESEEQEDIEEPGSEGDPVVDKDNSSDGKSEEIEDSDNGSHDSEGDDDGYASL